MDEVKNSDSLDLYAQRIAPLTDTAAVLARLRGLGGLDRQETSAQVDSYVKQFRGTASFVLVSA
jgi:hypothetical protein